MIRPLAALLAVTAGMLSLGGSAQEWSPEPVAPIAAVAPLPVAAPIAAPVAPEPPPPPTLADVLQAGVAMVVSIADQRIYVFKDGALWDSAAVSTGRRGHATPTGLFPILQKHRHHRSNLYANAPMPFMQRLTWGGVALHAGNVTRATASHGCIRLPYDFARRLFAITGFQSTLVLVTAEPVGNADTALALAGGQPLPTARDARVELAAAAVGPRAPIPATGPVHTIQLAAAPTPQGAAALWTTLSARRPELAGLTHQVVPAVVNARQVYRLRATGPGAAGLCSRLAGSGVPCFRVNG